ncbi:hypothetical protein AB0D04_01980 [Streptomyces sp. NPDC048483]|uniref:hypothetical protein n=1 Tax=Streptomyces sp. NPDC048483 TaxID=3154927 RepID=UPI00342BC6DE
MEAAAENLDPDRIRRLVGRGDADAIAQYLTAALAELDLSDDGDQEQRATGAAG